MISARLEMGAWSLANSTFSAVTPPAGRFCVKTAPFSHLSCQDFLILCDNCTIQPLVISGLCDSAQDFLILCDNCIIQPLVMSGLCDSVWQHHSAILPCQDFLFCVIIAPRNHLLYKYYYLQQQQKLVPKSRCHISQEIAVMVICRAMTSCDQLLPPRHEQTS